MTSGEKGNRGDLKKKPPEKQETSVSASASKN